MTMHVTLISVGGETWRLRYLDSVDVAEVEQYDRAGTRLGFVTLDLDDDGWSQLAATVIERHKVRPIAALSSWEALAVADATTTTDALTFRAISADVAAGLVARWRRQGTDTSALAVGAERRDGIAFAANKAADELQQLIDLAIDAAASPVASGGSSGGNRAGRVSPGRPRSAAMGDAQLTGQPPPPPAPPRFVITCEPCRYGRHGECPGRIVISTGEMAGVHRCDCSRMGAVKHLPPPERRP